MEATENWSPRSLGDLPSSRGLILMWVKSTQELIRRRQKLMYKFLNKWQKLMQVSKVDESLYLFRNICVCVCASEISTCDNGFFFHVWGRTRLCCIITITIIIRFWIIPQARICFEGNSGSQRMNNIFWHPWGNQGIISECWLCSCNRV